MAESVNPFEDKTANDFDLLLQVVALFDFGADGVQIVEEKDRVGTVRKQPLQVELYLRVVECGVDEVTHGHSPELFSLFLKDAVEEGFAVAAERCN